jgi:2-aminoadipate transaminase
MPKEKIIEGMKRMGEVLHREFANDSMLTV